MIEMLNTEIRQSNENYEKLMKELNNFKSQLNDNLKYENEQLYLENKTKQDQNESLRKELNELWSKFNLNVDYSSQQESIIKQLKQTQSDLQKSIKAQKETYEQVDKIYI
jgi:ABC-type transporter Mla subunit MlaD